MHNRVLIDLAQLQKNYLVAKEAAGEKDVIAVVKADAYGHGAQKCAQALYEVGCRNFAVASVLEAISLADLDAQILILGETSADHADILSHYHFCQSVHSFSYARALSRAASAPISIHLKFDSGMHRIGFACTENGTEEALCASFLPHLHTVGIYSHLGDGAHADALRTRTQVAAFDTVCAALQGRFCDAQVHLCNSDALLCGIESGNAVRCGILLYGYPSVFCDAKPILTWQSQVISVRTVKKGDWVGYGKTHRARKAEQICTIPIGYADGFGRNLVGARVWTGDTEARVCAVCMDMTMLSVCNGSPVRRGDTVTLIGEKASALSLARHANTIPYEILCRIGPRQARIYCTKT
jgi:alanine racemase